MGDEMKFYFKGFKGFEGFLRLSIVVVRRFLLPYKSLRKLFKLFNPLIRWVPGNQVSLTAKFTGKTNKGGGGRARKGSL